MIENKEVTSSDLVDNSKNKRSLDPSSLRLDIEETDDVETSDSARWIDNYGKEVENVFGFNQNAELVNGRVAMVGFLLLLLTELIFSGTPITKSIFGIG